MEVAAFASIFTFPLSEYERSRPAGGLLEDPPGVPEPFEPSPKPARSSRSANASNGLLSGPLSASMPSRSAIGNAPEATACSSEAALMSTASTPLCAIAITRNARTNWSGPRKPCRPLSASCHARLSVGLGRPERAKNFTASPPVTLPSLSSSARGNHRRYVASSSA